jgi:preprotein translocase subunit SecG
MQLNRTGIGLIAFFLLAGLALAVVPLVAGAGGQVAAILGSIGLIWVVVALGLAWFARRQQDKAAHRDWVFQNGIRGTATVLDAGSNTTVNEMPLMKLKLELDIPGVGRSEISRREVMPVFTANRMQPGLVLPAYANPEDPNDFVLVW